MDTERQSKDKAKEIARRLTAVECPNCGRPIKRLKQRLTSFVHEYNIYIGKGGDAVYSDLKDYWLRGDKGYFTEDFRKRYYCPRCDEVVAYSHEGAERILRGKHPDQGSENDEQ